MRGLSGDIVKCPECGRECDVAALVTMRWTGKWYKAPGLNRLILPVLVAVVGGLAALVMALLYEAYMNLGDSPNLWLHAILAVALGCGWVYSLWVTRRQFINRLRGPLLSLLGHLIFVGYLVGLGFLLSAIGLILSMTLMSGASGGGTPAVVWIYLAVYIFVGCGLFYAGRLGEKFIARCCIREYLRRQSQVD